MDKQCPNCGDKILHHELYWGWHELAGEVLDEWMELNCAECGINLLYKATEADGILSFDLKLATAQ